MREILFRGKTKAGGRWVFGSLILATDFTAILEQEEDDPDFPYLDGLTGIVDGHVTMVTPETIGQYTGLKDKNGQRIFEGDIVKETFEGTTIEYEGDWSEFREEVDFYGNKIGAVTFTGTGTHLKASCGELWVNGEDVEGWKPSRRTRLTASRCEVIGNIHDNPDLLKGD